MREVIYYITIVSFCFRFFGTGSMHGVSV